MKFSSFAAAALATVPAVLAAPVAVPDNFFTEIAKRQSTPLDVVVLQFALTVSLEKPPQTSFIPTNKI